MQRVFDLCLELTKLLFSNSGAETPKYCVQLIDSAICNLYLDIFLGGGGKKKIPKPSNSKRRAKNISQVGPHTKSFPKIHD